MGSITGAVVGALALTVLPEMLREFKTYQDLVYGVLLVGLLILRPQGLLGRGKLSLKFLTRE
jgi:branched-chain amino acid transport system permease protein